MSGLSEERGSGIPVGRVEGRTVELAYAEAADLLRAGKVLPARRHLIDAHQGGAPLGPRAASMEEGLWDLDFRLRFQTLEELMGRLEADDDEMLETLLRRMERLLSARCEDLAAYIRILGVEEPVSIDRGTGSLDVAAEEIELRTALDCLRRGETAGAVGHFRTVLDSSEQRLNPIHTLQMRHRVRPDRAVAELEEAVESSRWARAAVWGETPLSRVAAELGIADLLEDATQRIWLEGVDGSWSDPAGKLLEVGKQHTTRNKRRGRSSAVDGAEQKEESVAEGIATVRRTPHMELSETAPLQPGTSLRVAIYADQRAAAPGEDSADLELQVPSTLRRLELQVTLLASDHFEVLGGPVRPFTIDREEADTERVTFEVRVRPAEALRELAADVKSIDRGSLTAVFEYQSRPSGKVRRIVEIAIDPPVPPPAAPLEPSPGHALARGLSPQVGAQSPDLLVHIVADQDSDSDQVFKCKVTSPLLEGVEGTSGYQRWKLPAVARELVREYMEDFVSDKASPLGRLSHLLGAGRQLFEVSPKNFQKVFWQLVDSGRPPRSISVVSEEPFIPWELMVPHRRTGGVLAERDPLGVEFQVGRWIGPEGDSAPQAIRLVNSIVIAPRYQGRRSLPHAQDEAKFVNERFAGVTIQPVTLETINASLTGSDVTLLHFTCHGAESSGVKQVIYLEQDKELASVQIGGLAGFKQLFARRRTLVFLNACEVGRTSPALVGVGGFAREFIALGAVAVIAPLWSVKDSIAHKIACDFYNGIVADPMLPFARIFQEVRRKAYVEAEGAEDTYAAYCFYGDPLARLAP